MAKFEVDFEGYEGSQYEEYTGEDPRNGWYTADIVRIREADDQVVAYLQIVDHPDYTGWTRGWYMGEKGTPTYWKAQDFMKAAMGGVEKPVAFDPDNEKSVATFLKKAKRVKIQVGPYNDQQGLRKVRPILNAVPGTGTKAAAPKAAPAPEPQEIEDDLEDYTEEELEAKEAAELEQIITEEFEADLPDKPARDRSGAKYKDALIETILDLQDEDAEETAEATEPEGDEDGDDFSDGFEEAGDADEDEEEPEPEPEPAPRARRSRATAAKAAPAKAAPAAKATTGTRRRRG